MRINSAGEMNPSAQSTAASPISPDTSDSSDMDINYDERVQSTSPPPRASRPGRKMSEELRDHINAQLTVPWSPGRRMGTERFDSEPFNYAPYKFSEQKKMSEEFQNSDYEKNRTQKAPCPKPMPARCFPSSPKQLTFIQLLFEGPWQTDELFKMMKEQPEMFLKVDKRGQTALHAAVIANSEVVVEGVLTILQLLVDGDRVSSQVSMFLNRVDNHFNLTALKMAMVIGNARLLDIFFKYKFCQCHLRHEYTRHPPESGVSREWLEQTREFMRDILSVGGEGGNWQGVLGLSERNYEFALHNAVLYFSHEIFKFCLSLVLNKSSPDFWKPLLSTRDNEGRTPLHLLACRKQIDTSWFLKVLTQHFPDLDLNVTDFADRTPLHWAAAQGLHEGVAVLAKDARTNLNATFSAAYEFLGEEGDDQDNPITSNSESIYRPKDSVTALHLAVIHNHDKVVNALLRVNGNRLDINCICYRCPKLWNFCSDPSHKCAWTPFQIAALKGHAQILEMLMKDERLYDYGMKKKPESIPLPGCNKIPALHLAAAGGHLCAVHALLKSGKFDTLALDEDGNTPFHYIAAVAGHKSDFESPYDHVSLESRTLARYSKDLPCRDPQETIYMMDLLVQSGLDYMNQANKHGVLPQLDETPEKLRMWWFNKLAERRKELKQNLSTAANAVSLTAALVATASFVGPLQPPLGLSTDTSQAWLNGHSQVTNLAVDAFLFCDSLSFYLAIASIAFAMLPSWSIPNEGLAQEVRIAQRGVQFAVLLLFASLIFVICAFSAASIAVLPQEQWKYTTLGVVSTTIGAHICFLILFLSLLRLLKLFSPRSDNARIAMASDFANSVLLWRAPQDS